MFAYLLGFMCSIVKQNRVYAVIYKSVLFIYMLVIV
jgi:hypothetical protein